MGSSNQTTHVGLNQWVEDDPVLRVDFNADNQKLDETIFNITPVMGTYEDNHSTKDIILGFRPKCVLAMANTPNNAIPAKSGGDFGIAMEGLTTGNIIINDQGFRVSNALCRGMYFSEGPNTEMYNKNPYR